MTSRYKAVDTLSLFQHQANHYKNIIKPKRTILFPQDSQSNKPHIFISIYNNKHTKQLQRNIKFQNRRMLKQLLYLDQKKGLMQKAEQNYQNFKSKSKKLSLVNPYKVKQQLTERHNANKTLQLKYKQAEPFIGTKKEWAKHQEFNKKIVNRLSNKSPFSKQIKDTQVFMKMLNTADKIQWNNLLQHNKELVGLKNLSKKRRSKSTVHKKRKKRLNYDQQGNPKQIMSFQNEQENQKK